MRSVPISAQRTTATPDQSGEIDLLQILTTLKRGKWWVMFYTLLAVIVGGYYAFQMTTPLYKATATIALQSRGGEIVEFETPLAGLSGDDYTISTEVETLRSRDLLDKLVDKMGLMEDPAFNVTLRPPEPESFSIRGLVGDLIALVRPGDDKDKVPEAPLTPEQIREDVVDMVRSMIQIENLVYSYVFYITVVSDDPTVPKRIANGLANLYIEQQIAVKYEATEQATTWLNTRVEEMKIELETAENAVKSFAAGAELVTPESLDALNRQLKDRRDRIETARTKAEADQARAATLVQVSETGDVAAMAAAAEDPGLSQLATRVNDTNALAVFETRYDQIVQRAELESRRAQEQLKALEASLTNLETQVAGQSAELLRLEQLEREAGATRQLYEYFLNRLKETSAQQGVHRADSRVMSHAVAPRKPFAPRKMLIVAVAMILGLFIGCVLVLVREMRQTGFRSASELELATGFGVFAQIPRAPFSRRRRILNYLATKPNSALVEAVRNLRTSVMLSNIDNPPQVIMMASSLPAEGKTTQSIALAQSFASMGRKVLLIEGDIRRRTFQQYFPSSKQKSLIAVVSGQATLEEALVHDEQLDIDILMGEKSTVNAADFFSSSRFREFLSQIRAHYDVIIIDTPPVMIVPDARVLGQMVDAVIYVVHWDKTTRTQVQEGLHALASVDVKVSGLSFSQVDYRKARTYGGVYSEVYSGYGSQYYRN